MCGGEKDWFENINNISYSMQCTLYYVGVALAVNLYGLIYTIAYTINNLMHTFSTCFFQC